MTILLLTIRWKQSYNLSICQSFHSQPGWNIVILQSFPPLTIRWKQSYKNSMWPSFHSLPCENRVTTSHLSIILPPSGWKQSCKNSMWQSFNSLPDENRVTSSLSNNLKLIQELLTFFFTFQIYFYLDRCVHLVVILPPVQLIQFRLDQWDYEVTCMQSYVLYEIHILYKFYFYVIYIVVNSKQKNVNVFSSLLYIKITNGFP